MRRERSDQVRFRRVGGGSRLSAALVVALLSSFVVVSAAGAVDVTIGNANRTQGVWCVAAAGSSQVQVSTWGAVSYVVPPGMNRITSWSTYTGSETGPVALQVWRPTTISNQYTLVGMSPLQAVSYQRRYTFPLSPPMVVQPGDVLGLYFTGTYNCVLSTGNTDDRVGQATGLPGGGVGDRLGFSIGSGELLNVSAVVAAAVPTATSLSTDPVSTAFGQPVDLHATVTWSDAGEGIPAGTVLFRDGASQLGAPVPVAPLEAGSSIGVASSTVPGGSLSIGNHSLTAEFVPAAGLVAASTGAVTHLVTGVATTTALSTDPESSAYGQPVDLHATVTPSGADGGIPAGTVVFREGTSQLGAPVPVAPLEAGSSIGVASSTVPGGSWWVGSHSISAEFVPAAGTAFEGSTGSSTHLVTSDVPIATIGETFDAGSGSYCPAPDSRLQISTGYEVPAGMNRIISWSTRSGNYHATGPVALEVWRPASPGYYTLVGKGPVVALTPNQLNTFVLSEPIAVQPGDLLGLYMGGPYPCLGGAGASYQSTVGRFSILPWVGGTFQFWPAFAGYRLNVSAVVVAVEVDVATTTALATEPPSSVYGQPVDLVATVTPSAGGDGAPAGTVVFRTGTDQLAAPVAVEPSPADSSVGVARLTLPGGTLPYASSASPLSAEYVPGSGTPFLGSTGSASHQVDRTGFTTTLTPTGPLALTYPAVQEYTVTLTPTAPSTVIPAQSVLVLGVSTDGGPLTIPPDHVPVSFSGDSASASLALPVNAPDGLHVVQAVVRALGSERSSFHASTSNLVTVTVSRAPSTTALAAGAGNSSTYDDEQTFVATVVPPSASGQVRFTVDGAEPGVLADLVAGQASFGIVLGGGGHTVDAEYLGDGQVAGSTADPLSVTIAKAATSAASTGGTVAFEGNPLGLSAELSSPAPACVAGRDVAFLLFLKGTGTIVGLAPGTNVSGGRYEADAFRADRTPQPGVYDLGVFVMANDDCLQANPAERHGFTYFPQVLGTTTAVTVSPPSSQTYGTEQIFTATVDTVPPWGPVPTEWGVVPAGSVQFQVDSDGDGAYENRGDPVALDAGGTASIALNLPAGTHAVRADYLGDPSGAPDFAGSSSEQSVTVDKAPLSVTADDRAVQYSDPLPALTAAYDGFVLAEGPGVLTGTLACDTAATVNAAGQVLSPAGTYDITCSGLSSPNYAVAFVAGTLTVSAEDTVVRLAQNNPHAVAVEGAKRPQSPEMTFTARVSEAPDGSYGDIAGAVPATITLDPVSDGGPVTATCTVDRVQPATATEPGFELVRCTVDRGATPINVYLVTLTVGGGYYQGGDSSVLTVYNPTAGGSTGAGIVVNPQTGNAADVAYSARYLKSRQVQGKFLYVSRDGDGKVVHVLKGNVMSAMAITGTTAMVTGKATLDGIGNSTYILTGIDNRAGTDPNPAAAPDRYGQRVTDSAGVIVGDLTFAPAGVTDGNIYVGK